MRKLLRKRLTDTEWNALNRIATKTKADCWFFLKSYKNEDKVFDCEENKPISLRRGISELIECIVDEIEYYQLSPDEVCALNNLFSDLNIDYVLK